MKNVLVIDDESAVRKALKRVLERAGYHVRTARDAAEGLEDLKAHPADIVVVDIIMPKVHGVDVIRLIVKEFPMVRIVAVSGGGNFSGAGYQPKAVVTDAYLAAATKAGAHAVLTKPFRTQDVLQAMGAMDAN